MEEEERLSGTEDTVEGIDASDKENIKYKIFLTKHPGHYKETKSNNNKNRRR